MYEHREEFLLSKDLLDKHYFKFSHSNNGCKLVPIHPDSHLFSNDKEFNDIIPVLTKVLMSPSVLYERNVKFCPRKVLIENNYSLVKHFPTVDIIS